MERYTVSGSSATGYYVVTMDASVRVAGPFHDYRDAFKRARGSR
jgi:hypothetical protein